MLATIPAAILAAPPAAASVAAGPTAAELSPANWVYSCGKSFTPGKKHCLVIKNTAAHPTAQTVGPDAIPAGDGYGPSTFQAAYGLTAASAADGSGTTVAVVDAYNDPTAAADLATYRSAAGLPALTSGQFTQYNQNGQTSPLPATAPASDDWTLEESLDVDMVSAICPLCKIDLVEATNDSGTGLYVAENSAATTLGAKYISNSWGGSESSTDLTYDSEYFGHSGTVYTASAGDGAYSAGVIYPATSPNVVGVGGTSLSTASNSRGYNETVWKTSSTEGTGSGCSSNEPQPSWQASLSVITAACSHRVDNDVAADADPATGAAVYDTTNGNGGWNEVGGTSESSPIIASVFALAANNGNGGTNAADSIYTHTGNLYDVTSGNNGTCSPSILCTAATGYDGPTGWGTPNGLTAFQSTSTTGNTVTVTNPGSQTGTVGTAASLQISASDSASGQTLTYSATGLPTGLSINSSTGLISGTPTTAGTYSVTVTAKDTTGATGSASFTWTISSVRWRLHRGAVAGQPGLRDRFGGSVDVNRRGYQPERCGRDRTQRYLVRLARRVRHHPHRHARPDRDDPGYLHHCDVQLLAAHRHGRDDQDHGLRHAEDPGAQQLRHGAVHPGHLLQPQPQHRLCAAVLLAEQLHRPEDHAEVHRHRGLLAADLVRDRRQRAERPLT